MRKTLKTAVKDLIDISLILFTGFTTGIVVTLVYLKGYSSKPSFSDIGGMLAGIGSLGLLIIALRTLHQWKFQNQTTLKQDTLRQLHSSLSSYYDLCIMYGIEYNKLSKIKTANSEKQSNSNDTATQCERINILTDKFLAYSGIVDTHAIAFQAIFNREAPHELSIDSTFNNINSMLNEKIEIAPYCKLINGYKNKSDKVFIDEFKKI
ncbi:hypothetical protein A8139_18465 [Marinomonas primoryensis]|uniref:Uncharacterized protein n=1 Tax=Marinomonas primoryensis TaxID=178399 RepID=A0A2Z4PVW9_9GAMM|nr:hypothetical protein [Marinomonas primoryensis]AWY01721.1 hypothetical protein A8139_18465 [Marinomonas primoryensis]